MPAPRPDDELERLAALRRYRVLDTAPSPDLDRITQLVAKLLDVPIALVSLVDEDRQWFKSRVGLDAPETHRDFAFCAHAILSDDTLVVRDATDDERFRDNPLVTGHPNIKFYAGAPLVAPNGRRLGTLCAIDRQPRELDPSQLEILKSLSSVVMSALEGHRAEQELRSEQEALALAGEVANIGHVRIEAADRSVSWSAHAKRILGFGPDDGFDTFFNRFDGESADRLREAVTAVLTSQRPFSGQYDLTKEDGSTSTLAIKGIAEASSGDDATFGALIVLVDMTDSIRLRAHLERAERMATLGTLTAGVAHEINNPLTYIQGNTDMISEELEDIAGMSPSPRLRELIAMIDDVRSGTTRIRRIVQGLRTLGRTTEQQQEVVELKAIVDASYRVCANEIRQRAQYELVSDEPGPLVMADEAHLVQVVTNLLINAAHAIPEGAPTANRVTVTCRASNAMAFIEVRDTGLGMSDEVKARIFDPFFTTKPVGVGTGLGLSISHGIITAHGGAIDVESEVDVGTTVLLTLPRYDGPSVFDPGESVSTTPAGERKAILCVDDDAPVLRAIGRMLPEHVVHSVSDAEEALARIRRGETFDVILCDLMMPGMTGDRLYEKIAELHPEMAARTLIMTGGSFNPSTRGFEERMGDRLLFKPISREGLLKAIHEITS